MASATVQAIQQSERIPATFQEALKQGWTVASDKSSQSVNEKRREGTITMKKPGRESALVVDYIGTTRGYRFSVPKFAEN